VADRKTYFGTYRDRLLATVGKSWADVLKAERADPDPEKWDDALRERLLARGHQIVQDQVGREVELRSIYGFLLSQAKDDASLKEVFERLRANDDPNDPVCSTEPGKGLLVYREYGGKGLTSAEMEGIEDRGVRFGPTFRVRLSAFGNEGLPRKSIKPDTLGDEGHGRHIFRLVAVTREPAPEAPHDRK
jgi:hypothetical protein